MRMAELAFRLRVNFSRAGEDGRVSDTAGEEDGFAVVGIEFRGCGFGVGNFDGGAEDD